jgi:hypothetical protein
MHIRVTEFWDPTRDIKNEEGENNLPGEWTPALTWPRSS